MTSGRALRIAMLGAMFACSLAVCVDIVLTVQLAAFDELGRQATRTDRAYHRHIPQCNKTLWLRITEGCGD